MSPESFTDIRLYTPRLAEMIACQVKTLSFLTYLLKGFASKMKDHMTRLADAVVHLFKNCPTEAVDTRRNYWLLLGTFWLLTLKSFLSLCQRFASRKNATGQWQKCKPSAQTTRLQHGGRFSPLRKK